MPPGKESEKEHVLSKRLSKILELRFENDQDTLDALGQLSTFYTNNTLHARRNLRSQIEKRNLDINKEFLASFLEVKTSFDTIYNEVADMSKSIADMTQRLQNTKTHTKQLLQQTNSLQDERNQNVVEQNIAETLLQKYQLTSENLNALQGNRKEQFLGFEIFSVLDKVQNIHNNCKVLMQTGLQTLGVDIMEQMTLYQEGALERLYKWTQSHARNVECSELTDIITQAMARLQDRPVLFKYVMDEYCICRKGKLMEDFINALTRGGPSGNPAPIEMRAHDPQIYITDILVWLNKAVLAEKQNLHLLLKLCENIEREAIITDCLATICEGICQPLRARVEKVLGTPFPASVLYSVVNLLRYYNKCICKVVQKGQLEETLTTLKERCTLAFFDRLRANVEERLVRVEAPSPVKLAPTPAVQALLATLRDTLATANMSDGRETDMPNITGCVLEPLLRYATEQASRLPAADMAVYTLNCVRDALACLQMFEFTATRAERLTAQADAQLDTLVAEQAGALVHRLRLGPLYAILQEYGGGAPGGEKRPLADVPGMEPTNLRSFLEKLDYLAVNPDEALLPQIHLLTSTKHKKTVQKRAFEVLLAIYKQLYQAVNDPTNNYENPNVIFNKTPEELEKLLLK
nr:unnamed protein product [Callosobruchus chinensis]